MFAHMQPAPAQPQAKPAEESLDLNVWTPMGDVDRSKVRTAYEERVSPTSVINTESSRQQLLFLALGC